MSINFTDKIEIKDGKVVSIRDGVMEYLGSEIGKEPSSKVFQVYRSPDEVRRIADKLVGLPITDGHIDPVGDIADNLKKGEIITYELQDGKNNENNSTLSVKHDIKLESELLNRIKEEKPEASLGYTGSLIPHSQYDFEQTEIIPHHLAVVDNGRCGIECKFGDKKIMTIKELIAKIKEIMGDKDGIDAKDLQDGIGSMFAPKEEPEAKAEEAEAKDAEETKDAEEEDPKAEMKDAKFIDAEAIKAEAVQAFVDGDEFKKILAEKVVGLSAVIQKAKSFLDSNYEFDGKTACEIMKDAVTAEFKDEEFDKKEIPTVFKMLKTSENKELKNFGDKGISKLNEVFGDK